MPQPQSPPAFYPSADQPLDLGTPPPSQGYGGPVAGVVSALARQFAAKNRRSMGQELERREALSQQFEEFSKDPRYVKHPDLQSAAHQHALQLHLIPPDKKLPKEYEYDEKAGGVPAFNALLYEHRVRETKRRGEIPKPDEPSRPPEIPPPPGISLPSSGQADNSAAAPAPPVAPPQPGGAHLGPNAITTSPAIGAPPGSIGAMPSLPPPPPIEGGVPDFNAQAQSPDMGAAAASPSSDLVPTMMTPPEMAAYGNSIPAAAAPELAQMMGIDPTQPGATIDLRALKGGSSLLNKQTDRSTKLLLHGLDDEGDPLPDEQLPPAIRAKNAYLKAHEALFGAQQELARARARGIPQDIAIKQQKLKIAQQNADSYAKKAADPMGLGAMFGGGAGSASSSAPGGPSIIPPPPTDSHSARPGFTGGGSADPEIGAGLGSRTDYHIQTTVSGNPYVSLAGYSGKIKDALHEQYLQRGIPVLDTAGAELITEIDGARLNQSSIAQNLLSHLPLDASGRVLGGAWGNQLSHYFQTQDDVAAFDAFRASAIKTLRAMAGSKGFRMNLAEIDLAIKNDIPAITDTVGTALQKMRNVAAQLDNGETAILVINRAGRRGSTGGMGGAKGTPTTIGGGAAAPAPAIPPPPPDPSVPNPDEEFVHRATALINPATKKRYTEAEARAYLAKKKGGR